MVRLTLVLTYILLTINGNELSTANRTPVVVTTWKFVNATERAWRVLFHYKLSALDAIEKGCAVCEYEQCDHTVGYGGSPDENGETTLDAMIMDGTTMNVGAVGGLRNIKNAVGVARKVLENTKHSFLVGELATAFGLEMGFEEENLTTPYSAKMFRTWKQKNCQPNFRMRVTPDPSKECGPYKPLPEAEAEAEDSSEVRFLFGEGNHDTIGMVAVDSELRIASGTSTNGARHKVPGRVGDSPIAGAGSYANGDVGAAAATGEGDVMMRFLPAFVAVEEMARGRSPEKAAQVAVGRIRGKYPGFVGGVIAVRKDGEVGAACSGMEALPYCVASPMTEGVKVFRKICK